MLIFQGIKSAEQPSAQQMQENMGKWMAGIDKLAKKQPKYGNEKLNIIVKTNCP